MIVIAKKLKKEEKQNMFDKSLKVELFQSALPIDREASMKIGKLLKKAHPQRILSYYNSRMALLNCLANYGIKSSFGHLNIIDHHHLEHFPEYLVSISHTRDIGASVIAKIEKYSSIGLDIELSSREIPPNSERYYHSKADILERATQLDIWCIKEAAYKAISSSNREVNPPLTMAKIWINEKEGRFGIGQSFDSIGQYHCNKESFSGEELVIAYAAIHKEIAR